MLSKRLKISGHKLVIQPVLINKFWMAVHKDFLSVIWPPVCALQTHRPPHLDTPQLCFFMLLDHCTLQSFRVLCTYWVWSDSRMDILARGLKQRGHAASGTVWQGVKWYVVRWSVLFGRKVWGEVGLGHCHVHLEYTHSICKISFPPAGKNDWPASWQEE